MSSLFQGFCLESAISLIGFEKNQLPTGADYLLSYCLMIAVQRDR